MSVSTAPDAASTTDRRSARLIISIIVIILLAAALSVDVVGTGYGIKGDEATYVSMALSAAYDGDLAYQRKDLERFWRLYHTGPEGIFLKRGKQWRVRFDSAAPFLHVTRHPERRDDRLYFGKAFAYSVLAAPFVRLTGLNGMLAFHVLLLGAVLLCGYTFLSASSRPLPALLFTLAFVGASAVPVYGVLLSSDFFNFALVFVAYFLWLYKEVASNKSTRTFLGSSGSDLAAAALLGIATFSKLTNVLLVAPPVLWWWAKRRLSLSAAVAVTFGVVFIVLVGSNGLIMGEFNYQGGDRKTFYGSFPFDSPAATWNDRGISSVTNDADTANVLEPVEFVNRFGHNVEYFFVGRHFGLIPYFFPGVLAGLWWLLSRERWRVWRALSFLSLAVSVVGLLAFFPYSWSGGGGPIGNRYFLSLYPVLFFLTPPLSSPRLPVLAWVGGAIFTAHLIINPFTAEKFTYLMTERGAARYLPVELTMANDLPVMLAGPSRAHIPYGRDPTMLLYFLDQNAYPPEPPGMWIAGGRRADVLVRTEDRIDHLSVTAESPIATVLTVSLGGDPMDVPITPHKPVHFDLPALGVRGFHSYGYLLSAYSPEGFVPRLRDPGSQDGRNLGVLMRFAAMPPIARVSAEHPGAPPER
jgi:hypothetical protein